MKLTITQRLQLTFLLGQQEGNVGEIRAIAKILDKIQVPDEEADRVGFKLNADGTALWNAKLASEPDDIALTAEEQVRLQKILEKWPRFRPSDSAWLSPLMEQLS